jgi:hypothetical protein
VERVLSLVLLVSSLAASRSSPMTAWCDSMTTSNSCTRPCRTCIWVGESDILRESVCGQEDRTFLRLYLTMYLFQFSEHAANEVISVSFVKNRQIDTWIE